MPHDSAKFTAVMENTSDCLDDIMMEETVTACAGKVYDYNIHQKLLQDAMAMVAAFHTRKIQNSSCQKARTASATEPDPLLSDSLVG